jgi:hypothetical protein
MEDGEGSSNRASGAEDAEGEGGRADEEGHREWVFCSSSVSSPSARLTLQVAQRHEPKSIVYVDLVCAFFPSHSALINGRPPFLHSFTLL